MPIQLGFRRTHSTVIIPRRWSDHAVGWDIHAHLVSESGRSNTALIPPRNTKSIPTGLLVEPPFGFMVMICSRSGLAMKSIWVANAPGIIDPDYRGEIRVLLYNGGIESYYVQNEERVAQLFLVPITQTTVVELAELTTTQRGAAGFGSTGR